ncbi:hypothetical protein Cgig2_021348 [Carnegiea gigantea]|uniref:X8 domain-containing protein n=1 Tax=Carnegiea gigantea TaxID=171969 RepID=A0A9Q1JYT1_9CARY|nr:hypothetical protein Cgig2_021348 [Carnegiea gigantea]
MPAILNLQQSLVKTNLARSIKLMVPYNADAYKSFVPSQGAFRSDLMQIMTQLVSFLNTNGSPFVVNIYPFLGLYGNSNFPQDYSFFRGINHPVIDGPDTYYNAFDRNYDTLVTALDKLGYGQMLIVIGEVGWPAYGAISENLTTARAFNQGRINHALTNKGTSLRPGVPPVDIYLFSLLDEGAKSTLPGTGLLRNAKDVSCLSSRWCVTNQPKDLSAIADHFKLACSVVDCTTLSYGGSCNGIGGKGNMTYAFNSYYQLQKQDVQSCAFDRFGMVAFLDPSIGDCRFLIGVTDTDATSSSGGHCGIWIINRILIFMGVFMVLLLEE